MYEIFLVYSKLIDCLFIRFLSDPVSKRLLSYDRSTQFFPQLEEEPTSNNDGRVHPSIGKNPFYEAVNDFAIVTIYHENHANDTTPDNALYLVNGLLLIAYHAAGNHRWPKYEPFIGYRALKGTDPYMDINPFPAEEQSLILEALPLYWRPYVEFAFASGICVSELNAIGLTVP